VTTAEKVGVRASPSIEARRPSRRPVATNAAPIPQVASPVISSIRPGSVLGGVTLGVCGGASHLGSSSPMKSSASALLGRRINLDEAPVARQRARSRARELVRLGFAPKARRSSLFWGSGHPFEAEGSAPRLATWTVRQTGNVDPRRSDRPMSTSASSTQRGCAGGFRRFISAMASSSRVLQTSAGGVSVVG
jgi:hypothetical protein